MAQMPEVLILRVVGLTVNLQRNIVCFRLSDFLFTGLDIPLTPRSDDRHLRCEVLYGQLETNLIVSLTGASVTDGIGLFLLRYLYQSLRVARSCGTGSQQVLFVNCTGLHGRDDEIIHIFIRQIQNVQLGCAGLNGLLFQTIQLIILSYVAGYGNDFAVVVVFLQPRNNEGGIQTSGLCKYYFFNLFLFHDKYSFSFSLMYSIIHNYSYLSIKIHKNTGCT